MKLNFFIIFVLVFLIFFIYKSQVVPSVNETFDTPCRPDFTQKQFCAIVSPNIPDDPQTKHQSCGKVCKKPEESRIASNQGKYTFPIPKLLYDGIWNDWTSFDKKNIETKKWNMTENCKVPTEGQYAANKLFHLPECYLPEGWQAIDKDIYFPNWDILGINNIPNECNREKSEIHYWASGVRCSNPRYP